MIDGGNLLAHHFPTVIIKFLFGHLSNTFLASYASFCGYVPLGCDKKNVLFASMHLSNYTKMYMIGGLIPKCLITNKRGQIISVLQWRL